jgi:hypothetical protein
MSITIHRKKLLIVIICIFIGNIAFADMFSSAKSGNVEALEQAIINGNNINKVSRKGKTPLHIAVASYKYNAVKFLVNNGADIHTKDSSGNDALMIAASEFPAITNDLIKWGANPHAINNAGKTALEILQTARSRQIPSSTYRKKKIRQFKSAVKKYAKKNSNSQATNTSASKNCSKQEVLKMINAGYNKNEIGDICASKSYNAPKSNKDNNYTKTKIAKMLRESTGFTREFLNTIKMTYSNNILMFYDNCPKLMEINNKRISKEYAKKEKTREKKKQRDKQRGVVDMSFESFSAGLYDNPFNSSFKFKDKCYTMLDRAAKFAKTVEGVREVEILK